MRSRPLMGASRRAGACPRRLVSPSIAAFAAPPPKQARPRQTAGPGLSLSKKLCKDESNRALVDFYPFTTAWSRDHTDQISITAARTTAT